MIEMTRLLRELSHVLEYRPIVLCSYTVVKYWLLYVTRLIVQLCYVLEDEFIDSHLHANSCVLVTLLNVFMDAH